MSVSDVVLVPRDDGDPLARPRHGRPPAPYARDAAYRLELALKRLLKDHGFRCRG